MIDYPLVEIKKEREVKEEGEKEREQATDTDK